MNNEQKLRENGILDKLDAAFEQEIKLISTVEYNSNEICRVFYSNLRAALAATAAPDEIPEDRMDAAIEAYDKAWNPANRGRGNKEDALLAAFRAFGAAPDESARGSDTALLDWLQERIVDTIYLDDGTIIDVRGEDLRKAVSKSATAASSALSAAAPSADAKGDA